MTTDRLGLHHKDLLSPLLRAITVSLSEYCFANLYLFRDSHRYEVLSNGELFIKGLTYDGFTYLMPTVPPAALDLVRLKERLRAVDFLFPVPEEWLGAFSPAEFEVSFHEGDADYLYTVEKMSTLAGRKLHKKRNLLKQFVDAYRHEALPLTDEHMGDARSILDAWQKDTGLGAGQTDYGPCREALDRYEELQLCGGIYYAEDEPAGFVLGEEVNDETFVLHFAKGRTKFKGVYQFMFNNFAKILPPKYKYLNLEQDLEKENLRIFKSSYVPDVMVKKARVRVKQ
ncbi:MAG: DUF2156 domain-containing protein [Nitrospirae bacterium]|nr:DUF2156 domain-containing protein [Nitrospirota bacterium]NTW67768.1 DUF2156 domain-containing protein [Nitrospirota bacterium]